MRLLLDENIEHEVFYRLQNYGHEVYHVDLSDQLSKGATDSDLATFSRQKDAIIVTYDDDFRDWFSDEDYYGVLFLPDQTLSANTIADVLHEISTYYPNGEIQGFLTVGESWL